MFFQELEVTILYFCDYYSNEIQIENSIIHHCNNYILHIPACYIQYIFSPVNFPKVHKYPQSNRYQNLTIRVTMLLIYLILISCYFIVLLLLYFECSVRRPVPSERVKNGQPRRRMKRASRSTDFSEMFFQQAGNDRDRLRSFPRPFFCSRPRNPFSRYPTRVSGKGKKERERERKELDPALGFVSAILERGKKQNRIVPRDLSWIF